jgi:phosphoribosylanthranilate isomerase
VAVEAKICGLTRPDDASFAVAHGASRLGVVFAGGPREVSEAQAREIVAAAGAVPVLAVARAAPAALLLELAESTGVSGIQLHGPSTPELARRLRQAGLEVWRVAAIDPGADAAAVARDAATGADAVLVEPRIDGRSGGQGLTLDLQRARLVREALREVRMVLAGGLRPDTVAEAIRRAEPDLVDVSSGVESAPGRKDPVRLARFLEAVRDARSPA